VWLGAAQVQAQALSDPTRPPPGARGSAGTRSGPSESAGLVLQSVIISDTSRSAIISGEHVMLGGKIGPARLVKVSETAVVLLTGDSRRTLKLYPDVHMRAASVGVDRGEER
jgi:MSHA biogenesis protein MshK